MPGEPVTDAIDPDRIAPPGDAMEPADAVEAPGGSGSDVRRVVALAAPALVVLAAEPLYVLVDTAVVGHVGGSSLGALALGGSVMTFAAWVGGVLAYGTTGRAARRFGAGDRDGAVIEGVQASWIALVAGLVIVIAAQIFAGPVTQALGGSSGTLAHGAETWLRIASLGVPGLLLATAGNGWMRGVQDTRRPLFYVLGANVVSAILCPILVYPAGLGLAGSAIANVTAQMVVGTLFVRSLLLSKVSLRPRRELLSGQLSGNRDLLVRGAAFQASFLSAAAVASRFGAPALGAHQIALQLWMFCSLAMDAIAIAAQSLIGAALGASDEIGARSLARRIAFMGLIGGTALALLILSGWHVAPRWFSSDPRVYAQAALAWPWFVAMQPLGGVVFALDGVLIGAGDLAFLRNLTVAAAVVGFLPLIWLSLAFGWGITGIWAGLTLLIVIRLVGVLARTRSGQWAVTGVSR